LKKRYLLFKLRNGNVLSAAKNLLKQKNPLENLGRIFVVLTAFALLNFEYKTIYDDILIN
jgi:hypothetical protein